MSNKHHEWESQWREAFDGAEASPASHVWKNIESDLAIQESGKYRRGFQFYRAIAATLLLLIAGLSWYIVMHQGETNTSPLSNESGPTLPNEPSVATVDEATNPPDEPSLSDDLVREGQNDSSPRAARLAPANQTATPNTASAQDSQAIQDQPTLAYQESDNRSETEVTSASPGKSSSREPLDTSPSTADISGPTEVERSQSPPYDVYRLPAAVAGNQTAKPDDRIARVTAQGVASPLWVLPSSLTETEKLYHVPQPSVVSRKKDERTRPSFFAGLALAPSYFDPQFQAAGGSNFNMLNSDGPSSAPTFLNYQENDSRSAPLSSNVGIDNTPELSFTYGLDIGMRLSDHWVLESGIDYNRFSTTAETRWAVADVATGNRYAYVAANSNALRADLSPSLITSTPINNAYEFIAVPMKVGYSLTVSKLRFTVSSGVAANFFLGNVISDAAQQLADYKLFSSDVNSPFNPWYLSGILSGGVNYNILGNYFLSLTPSYAFALTELTRQESAIISQPRSLGVSLGFQYQF